MKNQKVIVINGLTRSGTNIVWNMVQSHPQVCSPIRETGKLLYHNKIEKVCWNFVGQFPLLFRPWEKKLSSHMDDLFYRNKLLNQEHQYLSFKYEDQQYSREEVEQTTLCLKSVDQDIRLSSYFNKMYRDAYFIGVVRDGFAFCNGWVRRGRSAREAGRAYRVFLSRMLRDSRRFKHYRFVRFEDILNRPFEMASEIYRYADLTPDSISSLRLKSKAVLSADGTHEPRFGEIDQSYWFNEQTIRQLLDTDVNEVQAERLSEQQRQDFEKEAMLVLNELDSAPYIKKDGELIST
jgi:hypothetical protein